MILVRMLTISEMGSWALFLTITTLFENTKTGLLKNAHIRFVSGSTDRKDKYEIASTSLLINSVISLIFILLVLVFGKWIAGILNAGKDLIFLLMWFIPGLVAMVFFSHFEAIQQSHFDFKGVFAGGLVRQLVFFLFLIIHLIFKVPLSMYLLGIYQSLCVVMGAVILYFYSKKYLLHRFHPTVDWTKKLMGYGGYIFGSNVISSVFSNLEQFLTAAYMSAGSVAYYNAAKRINGFIDIPTYAAADIVFPKMSQASAIEGVNKVKYLYEKMVAVLLSVIIPAAIFVILFPKIIIRIIAGEDYISAAPILQIYMLISIIGTPQHQAATSLYSVGKTKLCFYLNMLSLFIKLAITYICLIYFGFYGAAIGSLITSVIIIIIWYFPMKKEVGLTLANIPRYSREYYVTAYYFVKRLIAGKPAKKEDS